MTLSIKKLTLYIQSKGDSPKKKGKKKMLTTYVDTQFVEGIFGNAVDAVWHQEYLGVVAFNI